MNHRACRTFFLVCVQDVNKGQHGQIKTSLCCYAESAKCAKYYVHGRSRSKIQNGYPTADLKKNRKKGQRNMAASYRPCEPRMAYCLQHEIKKTIHSTFTEQRILIRITLNLSKHLFSTTQLVSVISPMTSRLIPFGSIERINLSLYLLLMSSFVLMVPFTVMSTKF